MVAQALKELIPQAGSTRETYMAAIRDAVRVHGYFARENDSMLGEAKIFLHNLSADLRNIHFQNPEELIEAIRDEHHEDYDFSLGSILFEQKVGSRITSSLEARLAPDSDLFVSQTTKIVYQAKPRLIKISLIQNKDVWDVVIQRVAKKKVSKK